MDEKYLSGIGAGLILASFAIIISFFVVTGVENKAAEENQTITFQQLSELTDNTPAKLKNITAVQEFRKFVGNTIEDLKDIVIFENTTLHSELKNTSSGNGTK